MQPPVTYRSKDEHVEVLIRVLKSAVKRGLRIDGSFKQQAHKEVIVAFREANFPAISETQVKSKKDNLKEEWKMIEYLTQRSGFSWDQDSGLIEAEDATWANLLATQPKYRKWKNKAMHPSLKDDLDFLFSGTSATGRWAQTERFDSVSYESVAEEIERESQVVPNTQLPVYTQQDIQLPGSSPLDSQIPIDPELLEQSSPILLSPALTRVSPASQSVTPQGTPSPPSVRKRKQASIPETLELLVAAQTKTSERALEIAELKAESQRQALNAEKRQPLTDRKMAIQIISSLAEEENWDEELLDSALEMVHNETYVDTIVMLPKNIRAAWIKRRLERKEQ